MASKPTALILYALPGATAGTVTSYIRALETLPGFETRALNVSWRLPPSLNLDRFDTILLHYSLMANEDAVQGPVSLSSTSIARIAASNAFKCVFVQDEHRNVALTIRALHSLRAGVLFTCMPPEVMSKVYPPNALPGVSLVNVLTGYVDESLLRGDLPAFSQRLIDVGYRARKLPFWLGTLGQEKWSIANRFQKDVAPFQLKCDISTRETDRLYGDAWPRFLAECKSVLGTESGASVIDMNGSIRAAVDYAVASNPQITFEEVYNRFLKGVDGRIKNAQISPRCFEAAASKTLMILYEGAYSGRLQPWRHYVPLKKDHSNLAEVVSILRNEARSMEIIENAYQEVVLARQNSYAELQDIVGNAIFAAGILPASNKAYRDEEWQEVVTENRTLSRRIGWLRSQNGKLFKLASSVLPEPLALRLFAAISRTAKRVLFRGQ